jgi:hypothetical protein
VTVSTVGGADEDPAGWSGLARLRRRVTALDGELTVRGVDGSRVTCARFPRTGGAPPVPVEPGRAPHRRPGVATLRSLVPPTVGVAVVVLAFYGWATHGADLERDRFAGLAAGQPVATADRDLPEREASVHLIPTRPVPPSWRCRQFTDGNFPLGMATYRICDDGTVLTAVHDLRRQQWR